MLCDKGAEVIVLASCITKGTPIGFPCPHRDAILQAVRKKLGEEVPVLDYTHPAPAC
jgi:predicted metal-binding protein